MFRHRYDGQRVADVELARQVQMKLCAGNLELTRRWAESHVGCPHPVALAETEAFHRTEIHVQQRREIRVVAVAEQQAVARHEPDEMAERLLNRREVGENVRVIELNIV